MIITERLFKIIKNAGFNPEPYSGRNMNGKYCISFCTNNLFLDISKLFPHCTELEDTEDIIKTVKTDNLGKSIVVY